MPRTWSVAALIAFLIAMAAVIVVALDDAGAHPGRLDKDGCHVVHARFVYRDGRVVETGDRHCHRALDHGLALDGKEALPDEALELPPRELKIPLCTSNPLSMCD